MVLTGVLAGNVNAQPPLLDQAALQDAGLSVRWRAEVPISSGDRVQRIFLVDDSLYVATEGGTVFALTADVGLIRWAEKVTDRDYTIYQPAHLPTSEGVPYVAVPTTGQFYIFDRFSGDLVATFRTPFPPGSAAVGAGNFLFMGSADGKFYALLWTAAGGGRLQKLWEVLAGGAVTSTPVLFDVNKLLFVNQKGTVISCFAEDKAFNWSFSADDPIPGDPFVDDSGAYVASLDRSVYKLDLDNGAPQWRYRSPSPLRAGPVVVAHTVFQHVPDRGLVALDAATGEERWLHPGGVALAAHTRRGDVVLGAEGVLEVVDHERGGALHTIRAHEIAGVVTNTRTDSVYAWARDGRVVCVRPVDSGYVRVQEFERIRSTMTLPPLSPTDAAAPAAQEAPRPDPSDDDPLRSRRDRRP